MTTTTKSRLDRTALDCPAWCTSDHTPGDGEGDFVADYAEQWVSELGTPAATRDDVLSPHTRPWDDSCGVWLERPDIVKANGQRVRGRTQVHLLDSVGALDPHQARALARAILELAELADGAQA